MTVDEAIYRNIMHLLDKNGISERLCTTCCDLNPGFFINYRKSKTKHFKICDIASIASFFEVSVDYLCRYKNSSEDFFRPKHKLKPRDEKVLIAGIRRLDPEGRIRIADAIHAEIERSKERDKQRLYKKHEKQ